MEVGNKTFLIYGLGLSGQAVIEFICKLNGNVVVYDDNKKKLLNFENNLPSDTKNIVCCDKINKKILQYIDCIIISPSVILKHKLQKICNKLSIPIVSELDFASNFVDCKICAITGTNGKTTTSTLLYQMFCEAKGNKTHLLGNIGTPLSSRISDISKEDTLVLEVSSFQSEYIRNFHPHIVGLLNLGIDHLSHHKNLENYHNAKLNIFKSMNEKDFVVLNADDEIVVEKTRNLKVNKYYFSTQKATKGVFVQDGIIKFADEITVFDILHSDELNLKGKHNLENALCACCMAILSGASKQAIIDCLKNFHSLANRLEFVQIKDGITYINDSKATNVESTLVALETFENTKSIVLLGGSDKGEKFDGLFTKKYDNVKLFIAYGQTSNKICKSAKKFNTNIIKTDCLQNAVLLAQDNAEFGDTILFSPACASFDEFKNYEERGEKFKSYI